MAAIQAGYRRLVYLISLGGVVVLVVVIAAGIQRY
jgi:hypothetical protein